ncbi:MAG: ABC transporter ATP-binding protein [Saccharofermentanales bacterium]|jgi:energy-coupling factor transporter ATP-binding protein EcfA2
MDILQVDVDFFRYQTSDAYALKDIHVSVGTGELVVVTGNSGCGKSTLLRVINGLIPAQYEGELSGRIMIDGRDLRAYPTGELAKKIGNVFQNPSDQFFSRCAEDEVALVGENLGMPRDHLRVRVREAFDRLNIRHLMNRNLNELSGGEKQRVAIASTLVYDTDIVIFDEPSASLDPEGIQSFQEILSDLKAMGKTIIIAEHRLYFLNALYDRLWVMHDGRVAKSFSRGCLTSDDCQTWGLRAIDLDDVQAQNKQPLGPKRFTVNHVTVKTHKRVLIRDLSFDLSENEIMGIVGVNGVGKSSLARVLCGLSGGRQDIDWGTRPRARLQQTYHMMQDVDYQLFFDTVEHELIPRRRRSDQDYLERVREVLFDIDLWDRRTSNPQKLSGGQKQRLALATALLSDRDIMILDEPTAGLDHRHMEDIAKLIRKMAEKRPVILITHDVEFLMYLCQTVLFITASQHKKLSLSGDGLHVLRSFFVRRSP